MKVLIVNTNDRGGAANACLRLHEGLMRESIDSKVLLKHKTKGLPQTFQFKEINKASNKLQFLKQKSISFLRSIGILKKGKFSSEKDFLKKRPNGLDLFSFPTSNLDITSSELYKDADIIHLHWVAKFLDYESFFKKNTKPVIWTLHDMNPFTGGDHYLESQLGMDDSGYPIPRILTDEEERMYSSILKLKQNIIQDTSNLTLVAPSQWLKKAAKESKIFYSKKVYCIPYGVDSEIYHPRDKRYSRDILNLPEDKIVVLFVADSISIHRKGFDYLKRAMELLRRDDVVMCAIGRNTDLSEISKDIHVLGTITDERLMSMAYSAADVFVIPSLMDNLPNTVIESLMCGTPVIGFPVGGIPDMIKHGFNGLLTEEVNSDTLVKSIELYLTTMDDFSREKIREDALCRYDLSIQAKKYIDLYQTILNR